MEETGEINKGDRRSSRIKSERSSGYGDDNHRLSGLEFSETSNQGRHRIHGDCRESREHNKSWSKDQDDRRRKYTDKELGYEHDSDDMRESYDRKRFNSAKRESYDKKQDNYKDKRPKDDEKYNNKRHKYSKYDRYEQLQEYDEQRQKYDDQRRKNKDRYVPDREDFREQSKSPVPMEQPNFKPSGVLAAESNKSKDGDTTLKYHEPPNGAQSDGSYRLQEFKNGDYSQTYKLKKSCYLIGRDAKVCDIVLDEVECSSQHAVIQFRRTVSHDKYGEKHTRIKPYIIDLETTNGTSIDGHEIPTGRYIELKTKDMIIFGGSTLVDFMFLRE